MDKRIKKIISLFFISIVLASVYSNEYKKVFDIVSRRSMFFGTIAKASVNDDNVNVRIQPTRDALSLCKKNRGDIVEIIGFSQEREFIDGINGYWLKINIKERNEDYYNDLFHFSGWIFSKYVDIDQKLEKSKIEPLIVSPPGYLLINFDRNGTASTECVELSEYQTFTWSDTTSPFYFTDPVGTFLYDSTTNTIKHLSYMGYSDESSFCYITENEKYFIHDFHSDYEVNAVVIADLKTNMVLYKGAYYQDLNYYDDYVTICELYSNRSSNSYMTQLYATEYMKNLSETEIKDNTIYVLYELNLRTLGQVYKDCVLIKNRLVY